jgi:hypothetical protein
MIMNKNICRAIGFIRNVTCSGIAMSADQTSD